ncbi:putative ABC transport system permease protein [Sanguibacter gelidistatuariae]|uniref:Putative ABC transport system permease protein n=1 Tax=Sanguibacter gelidistatuariae TaxID=1814289 RepID=A0A1G6NQ25_9MICO|nr:FtsX-like permease family protein [Sanguibacter gelidistatuariae]SDC69387.1 putative ABC transport system permease protein [Sanguibacter gelidistatuariae]
MFVALRDLRFAKGRFVLMTSVIALITVLVGFLASLTAGLGRASTSGIVDLPATHLAFSQAAGSDPSFTESQVDPAQWEGWAQVAGVTSAEPLGVAQTRASVADTTAAVTAFGVVPGSPLAPGTVADGAVILSSGAAEALGAKAGDSLALGSQTLTVHAVASSDAEYAHTPVVWISLADWQSVGARGGSGATADADLVATVVAIQTADGSALPSGAITAADTDLKTQTLGLSDSRSAISSFAAENLSLTMMQTFLVAISALVVGAFFTVWTINRGRDIAVLKALGASNRYLLKDAIGQALIVLALGTGAGALLAAGLGLVAAQVMPVVIGASTIVVPALLLAALGLVGALLAVVRITRIDPHAALAAR